MKRILIINVNWRGDVLFSTPFIRAVKEKYSDSFVACLVVPRCLPILENNPHLDEIIIFDEEARHKGLWGKLDLIRLLRSKHFDIVFLLHRSFTRTLLCWLAGIPQRVGYYTKKRSCLLTQGINPPIEELHKVEYFLTIGRSCGIEAKSNDYEFCVSQADRDYIERLLQKNGLAADSLPAPKNSHAENSKLKTPRLLVAVNPGGNWDLKRWPKENFARLCDRLIKDHQAAVIITGAQEDLSLARNIASLMEHCPLILCGQTTLGQLAALMDRVTLVISNDSGPMHIAVGQKTKTICLFGPTSAKITGPYGQGNYLVIEKDVGCQIPCYRLNCSDNRCMKAISVDEVLQAVKKLCDA